MASTRNSEKRLAALVEDDDEEAGQAPRPSFADGQPGGKPLSSADQEAQKAAARRSLEKEIEELVRVRLTQAFSAAPGVAGGAAAGASGVTGEFVPFTPEGSVVDSQEPAFGFLDGSGGLAAAINRAVAIAGRQDQEGELDPFRNHLSKKWSTELNKNSSALKWGHLQSASVNGLLAAARALANIFSVDYDKEGAVEYSHEEGRKGLAAVLRALELYQGALLFKDETAGKAFCESVQLERDDGDFRASFGNLPNVCPIWEKKAAEIKAYHARTAFRQIQDTVAGRGAADGAAPTSRQRLDADNLESLEKQVTRYKAQAQAADRKLSYAQQEFKKKDIPWEPPAPKAARGRGGVRGGGRGGRAGGRGGAAGAAPAP